MLCEREPQDPLQVLLLLLSSPLPFLLFPRGQFQGQAKLFLKAWWGWGWGRPMRGSWASGFSGHLQAFLEGPSRKDVTGRRDR